MLDERAARKLLKSFGPPKELIHHCEAVHDVCADFVTTLHSKDPAMKIDKNLVLVAALLHDIGRTKTNTIAHGVAGARIMRELTANDEFQEKVARICETHIGGGITRAETVKLGLPSGDYVPKTLEEKIVAYCDNLVDEDGDKIVIREPDWVLKKYIAKHGKDAEPTRMVRELNKFFETLLHN